MSVNTGGTCSIEGCSKPMFGRTWCGMHYATWRKYGDPVYPIQRRTRQGEKCSIESCEAKPKRRGMCEMHAKRTLNHGEATDPRERRFWAQVDRRGDDECWPWMGFCQKNGYGQYGTTGARLAHRIAYQYLVGPIPKGLVLDHLCHTRDVECADNEACVHRRCCNPAHLEPVSRRENIARGRGGDSWGYVHDPLPLKPVDEPKPITCTEDDGKCGKPIYKRTICRTHYRRWLRDPSVERPSQRTPEQRFWAKVDKDGPVPEHRPELGSCWVWTAHINKGTGYGQFSPKHGVQVGSHCFSYELAHGLIPEGHEVHHTCHVRRCVRPDHLVATTRAENMAQRKNRRGEKAE